MNVRISWTLPVPNPRQRPIQSVKIEKRVQGASSWTVLNVVAASTTSLLDQDVQPGDWQYRGTVIDTAGRESTPVEGVISVPFDPPSPLVNLTLAIE